MLGSAGVETERITDLERRVAELRAIVSEPDFYKRSGDETQRALGPLAVAEEELEAAVERWAELEQLADAVANTAQRSSDN